MLFRDARRPDHLLVSCLDTTAQLRIGKVRVRHIVDFLHDLMFCQAFQLLGQRETEKMMTGTGNFCLSPNLFPE